MCGEARHMSWTQSYKTERKFRSGNQDHDEPRSYASSIPLVMSCQTLAISAQVHVVSAQVHVVFDDWFTTVQSSGLDDEVPEWWATLFQGRFRYDFGSDDPVKLDDSWLDEQELAHKSQEDRKQCIQAPERIQQKELPADTKKNSIEC
jgi:hypothetical protein